MRIYVFQDRHQFKKHSRDIRYFFTVIIMILIISKTLLKVNNALMGKFQTLNYEYKLQKGLFLIWNVLMILYFFPMIKFSLPFRHFQQYNNIMNKMKLRVLAS